jgi:hypothetical protein
MTKHWGREASDIGVDQGGERPVLRRADLRRLARFGAMLVGSGIALAIIFDSWLLVLLSLPGIFVLLVSLRRLSR